jgi:uncharacterized membrane protein YdjX (TVP38/TMEM64 family)
MKNKLKFILITLLILAIFVGVLFVAQDISDNAKLQELVAEFGYLGVLFIAIVAGLNTVVPLPAATFIPIFTAAGLSIPLIVTTLAVGTFIADVISFVLGYTSRELIKEKYPKLFKFFYNLQNNHKRLIFPVVITYAAFVPFPNEAILIPLGMSGVKFKNLIIPLIIGDIVHQALLAYAVVSAFGLII